VSLPFHAPSKDLIFLSFSLSLSLYLSFSQRNLDLVEEEEEPRSEIHNNNVVVCEETNPVHIDTNHIMVLFKHRCSSPQQVPSLELRIQIPDFSHNVSHVRLRYP